MERSQRLSNVHEMRKARLANDGEWCYEQPCLTLACNELKKVVQQFCVAGFTAAAVCNWFCTCHSVLATVMTRKSA